MKLTYAPKDAEPREWELTSDDLTVGEVLLLEERLNMTMAEIASAEYRGSVTVLMTMWWIARKRDEPTLKFSDLRDVKAADLKAEYVDEEDDDEPEQPADDSGDEDPKASSATPDDGPEPTAD